MKLLKKLLSSNSIFLPSQFDYPINLLIKTLGCFELKWMVLFSACCLRFSWGKTSALMNRLLLGGLIGILLVFLLVIAFFVGLMSFQRMEVLSIRIAQALIYLFRWVCFLGVEHLNMEARYMLFIQVMVISWYQKIVCIIAAHSTIAISHIFKLCNIG